MTKGIWGGLGRHKRRFDTEEEEEEEEEEEAVFNIHHYLSVQKSITPCFFLKTINNGGEIK
jgi:hypothetical protein